MSTTPNKNHIGKQCIFGDNDGQERAIVQKLAGIVEGRFEDPAGDQWHNASLYIPCPQPEWYTDKSGNVWLIAICDVAKAYWDVQYADSRYRCNNNKDDIKKYIERSDALTGPQFNETRAYYAFMWEKAEQSETLKKIQELEESADKIRTQIAELKKEVTE